MSGYMRHMLESEILAINQITINGFISQETGGSSMGSRLASESEDLHPLAGIIGVVHGVNDQGAELVEEFEPTRLELSILAKHYAELIHDVWHTWYAFQYSDSYGIGMKPFAERRLSRIWNILTEEELQEVAQYIRESNRTIKEMRHEVENPAPCNHCGIPRKGPIPPFDVLCDACHAADPSMNYKDIALDESSSDARENGGN